MMTYSKDTGGASVTFGRRRAVGAIVMALAAVTSGAARADAFPTRPIKMVVGFSPGGND